MSNVAEVALEGLSIHLLHRAVKRADEIFAVNVAETNLTPRQYAVLVGVAQSADPSQTDLVEITGSDQTTLGEVVRRLLKKGLLQRRRGWASGAGGRRTKCTACTIDAFCSNSPDDS